MPLPLVCSCYTDSIHCFDDKTRKPCIGLCGHTICLECALCCHACPVCGLKGAFSGAHVNYAHIALIEDCRESFWEKWREWMDTKNPAAGFRSMLSKEAGLFCSICVEPVKIPRICLTCDKETVFKTNREHWKQNNAVVSRLLRRVMCSSCAIDNHAEKGHKIVKQEMHKNSKKAITMATAQKVLDMFKDAIENKKSVIDCEIIGQLLLKLFKQLEYVEEKECGYLGELITQELIKKYMENIDEKALDLFETEENTSCNCSRLPSISEKANMCVLCDRDKSVIQNLEENSKAISHSRASNLLPIKEDPPGHMKKELYPWKNVELANAFVTGNELQDLNQDSKTLVDFLVKLLFMEELRDSKERKKMYPTLPLMILSIPCVMETIMKSLSYFDIASLRKVATGPRNCILNLKPKGEIKSLELEIIELLIFCLKIQDDKKKKEIYYANSEDGCFVNHQLMEGDDIQPIFINDLNLILSNQRGCLEELRIDFLFRDYDGNGDIKDIVLAVDRLLEAIRTILNTRSQLLKVKTFIIEADAESKVSGILQYLDPEFLKTIEINSPDYTKKNQLETKNLSCLEQWKSASEIAINDISVKDFKDFLSFRNVQILVDGVTAEAISELKMKLLNSSNFNKFKIYLKNGCDRNEIMYALLDPPQQLSQTKSIWMFRIEDSNDFLQIICNWNHSITFSRVRP